jgi:murein DD-endopeptidase
MKTRFAFVFLLVFFVPWIFSQSHWDDTREIALDTYERPIPFNMDGLMWIAYELHLTNFGLEPLQIKKIDVFGNDLKDPLKSYADGLLENGLSQIGSFPDSKEKSVIQSGQRAVLHVLLKFAGDKIPRKIIHRVQYSFIADGKPEARIITTTGGEMTIASVTKALIIGSPVGEGIWGITNSVADGCSGHRQGAFRPINGIPYQKQKFGIDFIRINEKGEWFQGNMGDNSSWFTYSSEVIAVADAIVEDLHDDDPEYPPMIPDKERLGKITSLGGNYIDLNLGNNIFAHYAHLKPGSIKVKRGERIRKGQIIAKAGNSGNSTGPHLHFHISRLVPKLGEPIPYEFYSYRYYGALLFSAGLDSFSAEDYAKLGNLRKATLPGNNSVVLFSQSGMTDAALSELFRRQEFLYILNIRGIDEAARYFYDIRKREPGSVMFNEGDINAIGYQKLDSGIIRDAIEIFKLNTIAFPGSGNAYDSLGEAYLKNGDTNLATECYHKSLELDPENNNAKKVLEQLQKQKK